MDDEIRELERRAHEGDRRAIVTLRRRRAALRQDWSGAPLATERPTIRIGPYELTLVPIEPGAYAACVAARRYWELRDPREIFEPVNVDAVLRAGVRWVVVDLAEVPFLESRTVAGIAAVAETFAARGGALCLAHVMESCRVVLDLLEVRLDIHDTPVDALAAILAGER